MKTKIKEIVDEIWNSYNKMNEPDFCHYMAERFGVEPFKSE